MSRLAEPLHLHPPVEYYFVVKCVVLTVALLLSLIENVKDMLSALEPITTM